LRSRGNHAREKVDAQRQREIGAFSLQVHRVAVVNHPWIGSEVNQTPPNPQYHFDWVDSGTPVANDPRKKT
jgi:hypothetical protein